VGPIKIRPAAPKQTIQNVEVSDMSLVRWDPLDELTSLRKRVNRLFSETLGEGGAASPRSWRPACDIKETEGEVVITADLPGLTKDNVTVEVNGDVLTLSGERKHESEEKKEGYHRIERSHGRFQRSFSLGTEVDLEAIKAVFKDGVLTVSLPKSEAVKPKQIAIEAGE